VPPTVWDRLKDHKVLERTLAYAAAAYTLLHGVEMVSNALDWPHMVGRIVTLLLFLGLPIAVTLAWYHGHRAQPRVSAPELAILIVLLVLAGSVLWLIGRPSHERAPAQSSASAPMAKSGSPTTAATAPQSSVAVLPFVNMSEKKDQEYFADGMAEETIDLLTTIPSLMCRSNELFSRNQESGSISVVIALTA
jgi:adenylate cyclase